MNHSFLETPQIETDTCPYDLRRTVARLYALLQVTYDISFSWWNWLRPTARVGYQRIVLTLPSRILKIDAGTGRVVPIHSRIRHLVERKYKEAQEIGSLYLFNAEVKS